MRLTVFLKSFNKRRDDFIDDKAYNDYLEEVEDISEFGLPLSPLVSVIAAFAANRLITHWESLLSFQPCQQD